MYSSSRGRLTFNIVAFYHHQTERIVSYFRTHRVYRYYMDLPEKGAHCAIESCQIFDLLPITCPACEQQFCKTHAQRDDHACPAPVAPAATSSKERTGCQVEKCDRPGLVSFKPDEGWSCDACRGVYCVSHRHTDAHQCVPVARPTDKKAKAQALLTKLFPDVKSQSRPIKKPTDPAKAAKLRAIELMRMKHRAIAADPRSSAQPQDKVHLQVVWGTSEKVLWFVRTVITGRAVDLAARTLNVSREDGRGMVFETDGRLKNEMELGGQVEDGDTVRLVKV
ncbi:unnamed protein product [Rhizoctonia solani]|uniref:AN1-type domain-containing protein n=1 Tax=Rhizoctonia solani TaxID=456999 RepID=A0A8H3D6U1_9AGAM|nr:unnamed protein product [Rhizoctonia solani]